MFWQSCVYFWLGADHFSKYARGHNCLDKDKELYLASKLIILGSPRYAGTSPGTDETHHATICAWLPRWGLRGISLYRWWPTTNFRRRRSPILWLTYLQEKARSAELLYTRRRCGTNILGRLQHRHLWRTNQRSWYWERDRDHAQDESRSLPAGPDRFLDIPEYGFRSSPRHTIQPQVHHQYSAK